MKNVFECVARYAQQSPAKVAVSKRRLGSTAFVETSYAELLGTAKKCAALLVDLVQEPMMVPMLVGKSGDSVAAMLGALGIRRPFGFVNTKCRGPQIAAVLQATRAPVCVVDAQGLLAVKGAWAQYPEIRKTTWLVVGEAALTGIYAEAAAALRDVARVVALDERGQSGNPDIARDQPRPDTAAACLFTSGSTGQPKGVLVSEEDLVRRVAAEVTWYGLSEQDVLLSILPFSFDVGLNQLLTALTVGAELVLLDSWLPADIVATSAQRRVTGISGVPAIWQELINSGARFDKAGRHASLRYITISGGSLSRRHLEDLRTVAAGVGIFKTYGQTEAFRATSLRPDEYDEKLDSVGKPFPGVRVYVVREDGGRCDAGEIGEVVHTGLGIMMGYLDAAAGAVPQGKVRRNPFYGHDDPSPCAVYTGDMGYVDGDGYLFLKGRRDGMLKVMGNRVYPQEVANQVLTISGVREAVVSGVTGTDGQTVVVALLVVSRDAGLSPAVVTRLLRAKLPAFMIPKEIVFVDHIPRTLSGKLDERRLLEEYVAGGAR